MVGGLGLVAWFLLCIQVSSKLVSIFFLIWIDIVSQVTRTLLSWKHFIKLLARTKKKKKDVTNTKLFHTQYIHSMQYDNVYTRRKDRCYVKKVLSSHIDTYCLGFWSHKWSKRSRNKVFIKSQKNFSFEFYRHKLSKITRSKCLIKAQKLAVLVLRSETK